MSTAAPAAWARRFWPLAGTWQLRAADEPEAPWRDVTVPGCWEAIGIAKDRPGPFHYRRTLEVPPETAGARLWLRFGAVSYACRVLIDGREVGSHVGAWDTFALEITDAVAPGRPAELVVEVEKPASQRAGVDVPAAHGRYALRETLAGFLPYVQGHMFGGIWQEVHLVATGHTVIEDAHVAGGPGGRVRIEAGLSAAARLKVEIVDPDGRAVGRTIAAPAERHVLELSIPDPRPWVPADPARYTARLWVGDGDERTITFGLRAIGADGTTILLNGAPIYPRLVLSWGWYPDRPDPNPDPGRVRADLLELRRLGFNGVKLCLWFPPESYFELADEIGMLLWVELPMWLPSPSPHFVGQVGVEYERLLRQARQHPSVILYTLGCELNADTADLLGPLFERVKGLAGDALVRDNSGSGEAYGGRLDEFAEFYDYHFYADLPFLRGLLDHFAPRWRPVQPLLFGEFADSDAFRDPRALAGPDGVLPWWASPDAARNPQGARWTMDVTALPAELDRTGDAARGGELRRVSEQASLLHRKYTLELVRSYREVSGYVVTGERDTPISTAGLWDDTGRLRLPPAELRASNADLVVLAGVGKRRAWVAGGDRPAPVDPWTHRAGEEVRVHLLASHYGRVRGTARVDWSVAWLGAHGRLGRSFESGAAESRSEFAPGDVREVAVAHFTAPDVRAPAAARLAATVRIGNEVASNAWPLWIFPAAVWPGVDQLALIDPAGRLDDLMPFLGDRIVPAAAARIAIATAWTGEAIAVLDRRGGLVFLQPGRDGPLAAEPVPFWREAIRVAEPHPAWGDFPTGPFVGLQLYATSTDHALDTTAWPGRQPILRRVDARTGRSHDYAVELPWAGGRLIATTLRIDGRTGDQPLGVSRSPGAFHLLGCWLRYLLDAVDT